MFYPLQFLKLFPILRLCVGHLKHTKMAERVAIETVKRNSDQAKQIIQELKNELNVLNSEYNNILAQQLIEENAKLTEAVQDAIQRYTKLQLEHDVTKVPPPPTGFKKKSVIAAEKNADKPKKEKPPKPPAPAEPPVDVGRLDLRVAKVEDVQRHPDADQLYVLKVNCGEEKPRTVCSGLVKYVPMEELKDRYVVLVCNLKASKMRGITSEAMVLCASSPEEVEVLAPPSGCEPGEAVHCGGYTRQPDPVLNPKKKIFEKVAEDLKTNDLLEACYHGVALHVPGKGNIVAQSLQFAPIK